MTRTEAELGWPQILEALSQRCRTPSVRRRALSLPFLPPAPAAREALLRVGEARTLSEAGTRVEGMTYEALGSDGWRLVGTNGGVELTLTSHDSLPRFLSNSFEVISRRPR